MRCGMGARLPAVAAQWPLWARPTDRPADRRTLGFFFFAGLSLCFFFFGSLSLSSAPLELQPHAAHRIADSDLPSSDLPLLARHIAPAHGHGSGARLRTSSCSSCDAASPSTPWLSASVRPTHMQLPPARTRIKPRRRAPQRHSPLHRAALYPPAQGMQRCACVLVCGLQTGRSGSSVSAAAYAGSHDEAVLAPGMSATCARDEVRMDDCDGAPADIRTLTSR